MVCCKFKLTTSCTLAVDLENLKPPVMERLDKLLAVSIVMTPRI